MQCLKLAIHNVEFGLETREYRDWVAHCSKCHSLLSLESA